MGFAIRASQHVKSQSPYIFRHAYLRLICQMSGVRMDLDIINGGGRWQKIPERTIHHIIAVFALW